MLYRQLEPTRKSGLETDLSTISTYMINLAVKAETGKVEYGKYRLKNKM